MSCSGSAFSTMFWGRMGAAGPVGRQATSSLLFELPNSYRLIWLRFCAKYSDRWLPRARLSCPLPFASRPAFTPAGPSSSAADELVDRVRWPFAAVYWALASPTSFRSEELVDRFNVQATGDRRRGVGESLSDLTAADYVPAKDQAIQKELRRTGAALYLTSCPSHIVDLTFARWRDDAGFSAIFGTFMTSPPVILLQSEKSECRSARLAGLRALI